ncbi:MAG: tetratricopeptide repeat protein [Candidatus Thorarchaeota archaeon]
MNCPYCENYIEPDWDYCKHCNKPLIVNLERKKRSIFSQTIDNDLATLKHYHMAEELYDYNIINDEKIEKKIDEINRNLEQKQSLGESFGSLLLEKASLYYKKRDLSTSLKVLKLALNYFMEETNFLHLAISHNEIGLIHEENGFFDDAISHFEQSIGFLKKINEKHKLILVYNNLANIYYLINDLEHSYEFYSKALKMAEQNNFVSEEIKISSNLIDVLFSLKNHDKVKKILNRNLEYFRQSGDLYGTIISLTKLGKLNYHLGSNNYQYSHQNLKDALDLINSVRNQISILSNAQLKWECYLYLGKLNLFWKKYGEAEDYLLKSLEAVRIFELGESLNEATILKNLAKFYNIKGEYQTAIDYYNLSNEIYYKFGNDIKVAQLKSKIAKIFLDNIGNESESIKNYEDALEIFEDQNYIKNSAQILHKLGDIYINKGIIELALSNWQKALHYYQDLLDEYNSNLIAEKIKSLGTSNSDLFY